MGPGEKPPFSISSWSKAIYWLHIALYAFYITCYYLKKTFLIFKSFFRFKDYIIHDLTSHISLVLCYATFILKEGIPDSEIFLVQIHFLEIWRHCPAEIEFVNIRVFKLSTRLASWQFLECDSVKKNKCVSAREKLNKDG